MSIKAAKDALVTAINGAFKTEGKQVVKHVATHSGRFTAEDLAQYSIKAPAVLVSTAGFADGSTITAGMTAKVLYALTVIGCDLPGETRADVAEGIAAKLFTMANYKNQRWGADALFVVGPGDVDAQNLYSAKGETSKGVVVWVVTFVQKTLIGEADVTGLTDLKKIVTDYDITGDGTPEASDTLELQGAGA